MNNVCIYGVARNINYDNMYKAWAEKGDVGSRLHVASKTGMSRD